MASYIGYKERIEKPIDWTKITGEIIDRTSEIEAGREAKRAELDKIVSDNESVVSKLEMGESDTFNEFAMRGVDEGRKMLYESYNAMKRGEITPSEYKMRQQQQMSQWGEFSTATKTFNGKIAEVNKRAQEGTSSLIEMWKAEQQAQISELENQTLIWSPDGKLYMSKTDDEGKVINPNDVTSVSSFNKNGNLFVDRINVEKSVSERTAKIAQFKKVIRQYGIDTKEGKKAMAGYEAFKKDLIGSLTSADMQVGSILMDDVGGFNLSTDPKDRTDQYSIKMVANKQGVTEPDFSDDGRMFVDPDDGKKKAIGPWQREQAEKRVDESIEVHVPDIETGTRQFSDYYNRGKGADKKEKAQRAYELAMKLATGKAGGELLGTVIGKKEVADVEFGKDFIEVSLAEGDKIIPLTIERLDSAGKERSTEDVARDIMKFISEGEPDELMAEFDLGKSISTTTDFGTYKKGDLKILSFEDVLPSPKKGESDIEMAQILKSHGAFYDNDALQVTGDKLKGLIENLIRTRSGEEVNVIVTLDAGIKKDDYVKLQIEGYDDVATIEANLADSEKKMDDKTNSARTAIKQLLEAYRKEYNKSAKPTGGTGTTEFDPNSYKDE